MPPAMIEGGFFWTEYIKGTEEGHCLIVEKGKKQNKGTKQTVFISAVVVCPADMMMSTVLS